ncbi:MAG: class I SAM-dependent methyltransferase [Candidatus Sungbacteria bacterium]|nr:class I SAM-dependent methyltransferase [Candidatus Sungbacteria bacterium]
MEPNVNFFLASEKWNDYALLDSGEGMKLECFGKHVLARPESSAIWKRALPKTKWDAADGVFRGSGGDEGGGTWQFKKNLEPRWRMQQKSISFFVEPTPFRHVGVFPEQASQWEWIHEKITAARRPVEVLNLFGHTGIASLVALAAGAEVTHVDASKKIIAWARENQKLSKLEDLPIRWIVDDALKFVRREARRGAAYDGFIIDPPKFGRGPKAEIWKIYQHLPMLLDECQNLFSQDLLFLNLTCYAIRITPLSLRYALEERLVGHGGTIEQGDLTLKEESAGRLLPQAVCARWGV